MAEKWGVFCFRDLALALEGSLGVGPGDSGSQGLRGKEEDLSENRDYNLIERWIKLVL